MMMLLLVTLCKFSVFSFSQENPPAPIQGVFPHDPAVVAELQVSPDVPIGLAQLSISSTANSPSSVLVVTYNQLYAINKWTVIPGIT